MVRKGEYLERAVVLPGAPPLEGLYHRGRADPAVLFAPPHPARGGGMESPVIAELAWALTRAGHPTLRFNYPGVGASAGDFARADLTDALARAVEHLGACAPGQSLAGIGVGLGGLLLLERFWGSDVGPIVWVMPDPAPPRPDLSEHPGEVWVVTAEGEDPEARSTLEAWVARAPRGGLRRVPGADPWYRRNLVTLGRVVVELFHPPGEVALEPCGDDIPL